MRTFVIAAMLAGAILPVAGVQYCRSRPFGALRPHQ